LEGFRRLHALPGREPRRTFVRPCEVQGYVYDAFVRTAELTDRVWEDQELAREIRADAEALRERFDRDFWMEDRGYYALALDGARRNVDSITSNPDHLLWSDIVPAKKARLVADGLMGEVLSCGRGIRTMAASERGYDPGFYHNDAVWPTTNALIACGLRRYGFREEANRVAAALRDAAPYFDHRLPEIFVGYSRENVREPVDLPRSCRPQAWAAGAVPLLIRTRFGVEPADGDLLADAVLPATIRSLRLECVLAFGGRYVLPS
jgi:glycogen debranching enzyme